MRRHTLLLFIALCLHIAARGQTVVSLDDIDLSRLPQPTEAKALRYWFDDDGNGSVQAVSTLSGTLVIDVSALTEGLHTLHCQVIDTHDDVAYIGGGIVMKAPSGSGLTVKTMRYWYDDDAVSVQTAAGTTGAYVLDVSRLADGLHTLHYQLMGEGGTAGYVGTALFMHTGSTIGTAAVTVQKLMYWYDDDTTTHVADMSGGTQLIDASSLTTGLHTIHYQGLCTNGLTTPAKSSFFMLLGTGGEGTTATALRYWFDDAPTAEVAAIGEGPQLLDASALTDGLHTVHYQLVDDQGMPATPRSAIFLKMGIDTEGTTAKELRYWFDDDSSTLMQLAIDGATQMLDASALSDGMHTVHYFIIDSKGMAAVPRSALFMKMDIDDDATTAKQLRYWFDDATTAMVTTVAGGTQTLDVAALSTGLHTLSYQLVDNKGRAGTPYTHIFMKTFEHVLPEGHNRVTKYQYWLNENSTAMQTVELDEAANPYTLIALLPMQKEPIRSEQFHFAVTDGQPAIYAKNTLHMRFWDAQDYFTDGEKSFVDYSVMQEVTEFIALNNGDHKTVASPEENAIKWFKFYAEEGDTVTFRTDQAASLQVFSPEGKEIYSAQGSTSVKYGGCHTWVDGTYYVALHDVTGSKPNISLDFVHLAKYDVVSYDVATVGNGGCSTITFKGNGFRDLYAVDFISAANDSIHSFSIGHESDGTTSVTADFTDAELGKYTALFHFTEGKKYVYDAITVEEARPIELATEVTFPRSFGHVVTYTCKITNNGNMTAYAVPIYTWMKSKRLDGIYHIEYDGLDLPKLFDNIETDSLTAEEITELRAYSDAAGDDHYFLKFWTEDEDHPGDSVFVRSNYFFTNIAPYETKVLRLTISTRETDAFAYFTVPKDWNSLSTQSNVIFNTRRKAKRASNYCCIKDAIECGISLAVSAADVASVVTSAFALAQGGANPGADAVAAATAVADCVAGMASNMYSWINTVICEGETPLDNIKNNLNSKVSVLNMILSCLGTLKVSSKVAKALMMGAGVDVIANDVGLNADCITKSSKKQPGCPPIPPGGGGAQGGKSHDPNDIYGYLAESGSKYMTDEVEKVNYRIEFENDTAFATRSAMVVEIRDTLDSQLFDLSSYAPTGIKIGEKSEYLDGEQNFVRTIDMRPEINGLVEVEGKYDSKKGIMTWLFTSIDPMTMEPTNDPMDGFLPINTNGQGIGEVSYEIKLKRKMAEGTEIPNRASIVFDINDPILTPTWTNTIDTTAPASHVADVQMLNDSTATVSIEADDELSGPWRYNVYVQYGSGAWFLGAENVPIDTTASVKVYEGIDHGFYVVVTDSAGNVEQKEAAREFSFEVFAPQVDTDTRIELAEGWNWMSHNQQEPLLVADLQTPAAARMVGQDEELYDDTRLGWMGDLTELLPTQMYKLQMDEPRTLQLGGRLFNAAFRSITLYEGWNWIGYPVARTMTPAEALAKLEADEGDMLIGQDGMAIYGDGQWQGTLQTMQPGQGFMYCSQTAKNLFLNATAQASARKVAAQHTAPGSSLPDGWAVDKRRYPNVMGVVAQLWQGNVLAEQDDWVLAAFSGDGECRGIAQTVGDVQMMNVYGNGGEPIVFAALNGQTGEVLAVEELEEFRADVVGTLGQPLPLHIGTASGIAGTSRDALTTNRYYDLQGRKVDGAHMPKGIYITTDGAKAKTQKVVKR